LPAKIETTLVKIEKDLKEVSEVVAGDNVVLHFENDIDISRGDTVVLSNQLPKEDNQINTWISWLDNNSLQVGKTYLLQHRFKNVRVKVQQINRKWNVNQWQFTDGDAVQLILHKLR
jgi:sulfate adenylyltransferase subunit 1